jgi:predicted MFS family arabinose efflux permease
MWPVLMAPAITHLVGERQRTRAFSLFFATGIGVGVLGGLLGGHIPGWFQSGGSSAIVSKQQTMLFGVILAALAMLPLSRVALTGLPKSKSVLPKSRVLLRFLTAIAVWNVATGAFNPFFNAYFSRHVGVDVVGIGSIFAAGQLAQVGAILLAPVLLARFGFIPGIAAMQAATAIALAALAIAPSAGSAVVAYASYMSFQWMSEPGIYSVLMGLVKPTDRGAAAALNVLVGHGAQAAAAALSGTLIQRFGYPASLGTAAVVAFIAAALFRLLVRSPEAPAPDSAPA